MRVVESVRALREALPRSGETIALVPTMGNLHAGHYALVELARRHADRVVASVFVNPIQFGPNEDFDRYPRTPDADAEGLRHHGCDLMFLPEPAAIYPFGTGQAHRLQVPAMADVLCGRHRPGHFDGVVTVVSRLFNLVRPDLAVFGEKDFQQLRILERMTVDLGYPIRVLRGPTEREASGLALSSRNRYLDPVQRALAPQIQASLRQLSQDWRAGVALAGLEQAATARLQGLGFGVDYVEVRREVDLQRPEAGERDGLRVFVAARLGAVRLIDNLPLRHDFLGH